MEFRFDFLFRFLSNLFSGGQSVFITGSFNNWKQTVELLPQEEDGEWKVVQQLVPGKNFSVFFSIVLTNNNKAIININLLWMMYGGIIQINQQFMMKFESFQKKKTSK